MEAAHTQDIPAQDPLSATTVSSGNTTFTQSTINIPTYPYADFLYWDTNTYYNMQLSGFKLDRLRTKPPYPATPGLRAAGSGKRLSKSHPSSRTRGAHLPTLSIKAPVTTISTRTPSSNPPNGAHRNRAGGWLWAVLNGASPLRNMATSGAYPGRGRSSHPQPASRSQCATPTSTTVSEPPSTSGFRTTEPTLWSRLT